MYLAKSHNRWTELMKSMHKHIAANKENEKADLLVTS